MSKNLIFYNADKRRKSRYISLHIFFALIIDISVQVCYTKYENRAINGYVPDLFAAQEAAFYANGSFCLNYNMRRLLGQTERKPLPVFIQNFNQRRCEVTDKELKQLSRTELLELLIKQTEENERLKARLEECEEQLKDRNIRFDTAGSLAEAALSLNNVFQAADSAAKQYLDNIEKLHEQEEQTSRELRESTQREADEILRAANEAAQKTRAKADAYWKTVVNKATAILNDHDALRAAIQSAISESPEASQDAEA